MGKIIRGLQQNVDYLTEELEELNADFERVQGVNVKLLQRNEKLQRGLQDEIDAFREFREWKSHEPEHDVELLVLCKTGATLWYGIDVYNGRFWEEFGTAVVEWKEI